MLYLSLNFCASTMVEPRSKLGTSYGYCPFQCDGFVVVDSMLIVTPIVGFCNFCSIFYVLLCVTICHF